MDAAVARAHAVGKAVQRGAVAGVWQQRHLDGDIVAALGQRNRLVEQRRCLRRRERAGVVGDAVLGDVRPGDDLARFVVPVGELDRQPAVEVRGGLEAAFDQLGGIVSVVVEDAVVVEPAQFGTGLLRFLTRQWGDGVLARPARFERLLELLAVAPDGE